MIIFCPNVIYFAIFLVGEIRNSRLCQTVVFAKKNHESAKFTKLETREAHSAFLIAKHVLEMSTKLIFQCERFEKNCFALITI